MFENLDFGLRISDWLKVGPMIVSQDLGGRELGIDKGRSVVGSECESGERRGRGRWVRRTEERGEFQAGRSSPRIARIARMGIEVLDSWWEIAVATRSC